MDYLKKFVFVLTVALAQVYAINAHASDGFTLNNIEHQLLAGGKSQLRFDFDKPLAADPLSFSIENPAKVSLDFADVSLALPNNTMRIDSGGIDSLRAVQNGERSRIVVSLNRMLPYDIRREANSVYVRFDSSVLAPKQVVTGTTLSAAARLNDIDFRRGENGEGKVRIRLSDSRTVVNMEEKGTKLVVDFLNANLPEKLVRRLDVVDFATPVQTIDAFNSGSNSRIVIGLGGSYEHMAYQTGNEFTVDVRPLTQQEEAAKKVDKFGYSGEKLSLNFQNIEVRAVLQLLADFTGLNVVASDTVTGNITLRLKNVPWDQALDIILRTRGLGMRQTGNVVLIAPNAEIAQREKEELEAQKQIVDLAPLRMQYYQINYAKAEEIATLLKGKANSILTERGSVSIDSRTNTLMVLETAERHEDVANLIEKLDVPIKQVLIESRIVVASDEFGHDLGVRFGVSGRDTIDTFTPNDTLATSGSSSAANAYANGATTGDFNVNLPAAVSSPGQVAFALLGTDYLVDLELSALQTEGKGEVLSNPRVITANQSKATIEQGVEVPYQEASSSGATSVSFKKAVLSLEVTPQITPDERVVLDLTVNSDSVGGIYAGVPSINTRSVTTQVLVSNGDTVVLGGVYEHKTASGVSKVPFFGDLPLLGALFRSKTSSDSKQELLIFVTPKILNDAMKVGQ